MDYVASFWEPDWRVILAGIFLLYLAYQGFSHWRKRRVQSQAKEAGFPSMVDFLSPGKRWNVRLSSGHVYEDVELNLVGFGQSSVLSAAGVDAPMTLKLRSGKHVFTHPGYILSYEEI